MQVILVDSLNNQIGVEEKLKAHKLGLLHRAFSVFIFNKKRELMLQKRSFKKYHSPGLWSNTCCSHPEPGEDLVEAANKRLEYEMGLNTKLKEVFPVVYKADVGKGLVEHEYDIILFGRHEGPPLLNVMEVSNWRWISLENLRQDIEKNPQNYTYWLKLTLPRVAEELRKTSGP